MLDVGIVSERRDGRDRYYSLRRDGLEAIDLWLIRLDNFWAQGLERLGQHLEAQS
jgi:DNA-binding transcriptional ArsR family regulator